MPSIKRDYWPTQGWRSTTPEEQGMDAGELRDVLQRIAQEAPGIHSLQVVRHGYLVLDAYFYPYAAGLWHSLASVTKSFTSTLIGIALDKGFIQGVKQPVLDFFPGRKIANPGAVKETISLENLLTMTSGLHCIFEQHELSLQQMQQSADWVQFVLDQPVDYAPGTHYVYCSPGSHLLSAIIQQSSGMNTLSFAQKYLFAPLGISKISWPADPQGVNFGWGQVRLGPYDMAKLGYLYLNDGVWDGQQVLSRSWIAAATRKQVVPQAGILADGYGYQWWILAPDIYCAMGRAGQIIAVLPAHDMVVVFTGARTGQNTRNTDKLLALISGTIKSETPLPQDTAAFSLLEAEVARVAATPKAAAVPPMPPIAGKIASQTYAIDAGWLGFHKLSLTFKGSEAQLILSGDSGHLELPVGLDNNYRIVRGGDFGLPAGLRGWWKGPDTFVLNYNTIGNINNYELSLKFAAEQVSLHLEDFTGKPMPESAVATGVLINEGQKMPPYHPEKALLEWPKH